MLLLVYKLSSSCFPLKIALYKFRLRSLQMANCKSSYSDPTAQIASSSASSGIFPLIIWKFKFFAPFGCLVAEKTQKSYFLGSQTEEFILFAFILV